MPGERIGDVLARVESHAAETGEDPREAFGHPTEYADEVSAALGNRSGGGWLTALRPRSWQEAAVGVLFTVAAGLASSTLIGAVVALIEGTPGPFGVPAGAAFAGALVLAGVVVVALVRHTRRELDEVVDPRTGENMSPAFPRWASVTLVVVPLLMIVVAVLTSL